MYLSLSLYTYIYIYIYTYFYFVPPGCCIGCSVPGRRATRVQSLFVGKELNSFTLIAHLYRFRDAGVIHKIEPPHVISPMFGRGVILLEALIELKFLNSSFSSSNFLLKLDKHFPVEQFEASRAIRGSSISVRSSLPPSPPLRLMIPESRVRTCFCQIVCFASYVRIQHLRCPYVSARPFRYRQGSVFRHRHGLDPRGLDPSGAWRRVCDRVSVWVFRVSLFGSPFGAR